MPLVSVIVPVFNSERFLDACLGSLEKQTLGDIEIICIDDASTDGSRDILMAHAGRDPRVQVTCSPVNQGVSVSRNLGISKASGEYLSFVDSDDFVSERFYERLHGTAVKGGLDIVKGSIRSYDPETGKSGPAWPGMDVDSLIGTKHKAYFFYGFTSALFRREFVLEHGIRFPEHLIVNEDPCFTVKAVLLTDKVALARDAVYSYTYSPTSASHSDRTVRHIQDQLKGTEIILDTLDSLCQDPRHHAIVTMFLMEHLMEWCRRDDVPEEVTRLAASGLDAFMHRCRRVDNTIGQLVTYFMHRKNIETLNKLRLNIQRHA